MRSLFNILKFIISHPLSKKNKSKAIRRFLGYQVAKRIFPSSFIFTFTPKTKFILEQGMTGATGNVYAGLHEFQDMGFLLHFLREEDQFIDVGANIGSYTILASGEIGARTIAFEPIPATFERLVNNINLNGLGSKTTLYHKGLGSKKAVIQFTSDLDTINHVAVDPQEGSGVSVEIDRIDDVIPGINPALLKIDVEGYELEVLRGASNLLQNKSLKAIIIELNGSGNKYGFPDEVVHNTLLEYDFEPYFYEPFTRKITPLLTSKNHNRIYIRDLMFVEHRVKQARLITVFGSTF